MWGRLIKHWGLLIIDRNSVWIRLNNRLLFQIYDTYHQNIVLKHVNVQLTAGSKMQVDNPEYFWSID